MTSTRLLVGFQLRMTDLRSLEPLTFLWYNPFMKSTSTKTSKKEEKTPSLVIDNTILPLSVAWENIDSEFQKVIKRYQPHIKTSGFRKGKAPANLVIQTLGKEALYNEALEKILPEAYTKLIVEKKLQPLGLPSIKLLESGDNKEWKFEVHVAERPSLKLGEYKKLIESAKKEFDTEQKKASKENKTEDKELDEKAKAKKEADEKNLRLNAILKKLVEELRPQVPQLAIEQEAQRTLQELENQLRQLNIDSSSYLKSLGKTVDALQQEHLTRALATWQVELLLSAIADAENFTIDEKEVEKVAHGTPGEHLDHSSVRQVLLKQKVLDFLLTD